ncbi:MAG TPA: pitrilysin family protein [Vicinamibacterales bacterium]|nr:pitrilysin family protein [Vicinamibacterales bacterium]
MSRVDRTKMPVPGAPRPFAFPTIARATLGNGLQVRVISHTSVPVAATVLLVPGGSSADAPDQAGLASLTADLMDEGSRGHSALEISDRIARMGGDLDLEVSHDATVISLATLDRFLDLGLALVHEICTTPNLAEPDFLRVRQLRLERLRQLRDHPAALADRAFAQLLYQSHPYAQPGHGTAASLGGLTPADVRQYHAAMFQPDGATLVVAGNQPAAVLLEKATAAFEGWLADPSLPMIARDRGRLDPPRAPSARLAIVPRPGAAQSELRLGHVSTSRRTPDYHALVLLNTVLGGQFVSRLNMNLREDKGYTYGVRTGFDLRRGDGPFVLQTSVGTEVTVPALGEAFNELRAIRNGRPVTSDELALAKSSVALGYPRGFETVQQIARSVAQLALHDLLDSYFEEFVPRLEAVTLDEVAAAAQRYLDPERMTAVIVGDHDRVGETLDVLGLGPAQTVAPPI